MPRPRAAHREVRVRRVHRGRADRAEGRRRCRAHELAGGDPGLPDGHGVVDVVGRLGVGWLFSGIHAIDADRLGGHEAAVVRSSGRVHPEPAFGRAVTVRVDARAARVVDRHRDRRALGDRDARRDHELVRRALVPVLAVAAHLRGAGGRVRVRGADGVHVRDRMRQRVGVVRAGRIPRIGGLAEVEARRHAVDEDGVDRHVRPGGRARDRGALEIEAEVGQALRRLDGQVGVVSRQELVRLRVVDDVQIGVNARVAAVPLVGIHAVAEVRERAHPGRARDGVRKRLRHPHGQRERCEREGGRGRQPHPG